jgi:riboflavin synthase
MFTGLIEDVGTVRSIRIDGDRSRLTIEAAVVTDELPVGDSVSVDGVCVTATDIADGAFSVDLMRETLRVTALGQLREGTRVNLERAMRVGDRLGGHLVQGHVDAIAPIVGVDVAPGTTTIALQVPEELRRYLVVKGSLCVAGVSLTIGSIEGDVVRIGLIPHTVSATNLGDLEVGHRVNIEVDVIAKYVEQMLPGKDPS